MDEGLYHEDGFRTNSLSLKPPPAPPPIDTKLFHPLPTNSASFFSSSRQMKPDRRKTRPSLGDWVLIRDMSTPQPEIAQQISQ
jgi:hypothetical protein